MAGNGEGSNTAFDATGRQAKHGPTAVGAESGRPSRRTYDESQMKEREGGDGSDTEPFAAVRSPMPSPPTMVGSARSRRGDGEAGRGASLADLSASYSNLETQLIGARASLSRALGVLHVHGEGSVPPPLEPAKHVSDATVAESAAMISYDADLQTLLEKTVMAVRMEERARGADAPEVAVTLRLKQAAAATRARASLLRAERHSTLREAEAAKIEAEAAAASAEVVHAELVHARAELAGAGLLDEPSGTALAFQPGTEGMILGGAPPGPPDNTLNFAMEGRPVVARGGPDNVEAWRTDAAATAEMIVVWETPDADPHAAAHLTRAPTDVGLEATAKRRRERSRLDRLLRTRTKSNFDLVVGLPEVLRHHAQNLIQWVWFERFILGAIIANTVLLALDSPLLDKKSDLAKFLVDADVVFTVLFTAEMVVKFFALGLVHSQTSYFRDAWNWLDFVIVVTGLVTLLGGDGVKNYSGLRMFRVLRPLRTITHLAGLRVIVNALLRSIPLLMNTLIICLFYFLVFGIIGVQSWAGQFRNRCFNLETGLLNEEDERLCGGWHTCAETDFCGEWTQNPNNDVTSFDNILWASNTIFQSITLEGWAQVMYWAQDATTVWCWPYFILLILFGAFILINLTLAVIMTKFRAAQDEQEAQEQLAKEEQRRAELARKRAMERQISRQSGGSGGSGNSRGLRRSGTMPQWYEKSDTKLVRAQREANRIHDRARIESKLDALVTGRDRKSEAAEEQFVTGFSSFAPPPAQSAVSPVAVAAAELVTIADDKARRYWRRAASHASGAEEDEAEVERFAAEESKRMSGSPPQPSNRRGDHAVSVSASVPSGAAEKAGKEDADSRVPRETIRVPKDKVFVVSNPMHPNKGMLRKPSIMGTLVNTPTARKLLSTRAPVETRWLANRQRERSRRKLDSRRRRMRSASKCGRMVAEAQDRAYDWWLDNSVPFVIARDKTRIFIEMMLFRGFIALAIVANTVILAIDHHGASPELRDSLATGNNIFTWIFIFEMVIKLFGMGWRDYSRDAFNVFDGVVVAISIVEMIVDTGGAFTAFRIVRIFRIIKLVRYLSSMQMIISVVSRSMSSFGYIALLLIIFCFIYSVLGMQVFGGLFDFEDPLPRANFDSLHWSFVTVFQVLSGEGWNEVMYLGVAGGGVGAIFFFLSWVVIGQFILLNLFLAVLLDGFSDFGEEEDDAEEKQNAEKAKVAALEDEDPDVTTAESKADVKSASAASDATEVETRERPATPVDEEERQRTLLQKIVGLMGYGPKAHLQPSKPAGRKFKPQRKVLTAEEREEMLHPFHWRHGPPKDKETFRNRHMFCLSPHSSFSEFCRRIISHKKPMLTFRVFGKRRDLFFDNIILFLIAVSSILLTLETPRVETPGVLVDLELVFTILFTVEVVIKVSADGLVMHRQAYLRNGYNVIDFIVVLAALMNQVLAEFDYPFVRTLRLVRCLRPLRVISRNRGMKMVVNALFMSVGGIANVTFVLFLVWLMFAILGVSIFGGKLHSCTDPSFPEATHRDGDPSLGILPCDESRMFTDEQGELVPAEWVSMSPNFDNTLQGLLALFVMSSGEGWPDVMYAASDATGVDMSPKRDHSWYNAYYFVIFVCIGGFFLLNLFIGVVFDNFMRLKKEMESFGFLTEEQREWVKMQRKLASTTPVRTLVCPSPNKFRLACFNIVKRSSFEGMIMFMIAANVTVLALQYDKISESMSETLEDLNLFFTFVFVVEAVMKTSGLGFSQYWSDPWNRFDLAVVIGSVMDIFLTILDTSLFRVFRVGRALARVFRLLRVARVIRLAKAVAGLRRLVLTLWSSLPSLINVGSLLMLLFFIYAVIGVFMFALVELQESITVHASFQTFPLALVTLFRISTGEGWEGIMFDAMNTEAGGHGWAWMYFVSFVMLAMFIMLNLFIMIIVEDFDEMENEVKNTVGMSPEHVEEFRTVWATFDPRGTQFIDFIQVEPFMRQLPPPMGIPPHSPFKDFLKLMTQLNVKIWDGKVNYRELLLAVHRSTFATDIPDEVARKVDSSTVNKVQKNLARRYDALKGATAEAGGDPTATADVSDVYATLAIQRAFRQRLAQARERRKETSRKAPQTSPMRKIASAPHFVEDGTEGLADIGAEHGAAHGAAAGGATPVTSGGDHETRTLSKSHTHVPIRGGGGGGASWAPPRASPRPRTPTVIHEEDEEDEEHVVDEIGSDADISFGPDRSPDDSAKADSKNSAGADTPVGDDVEILTRGVAHAAGDAARTPHGNGAAKATTATPEGNGASNASGAASAPAAAHRTPSASRTGASASRTPLSATRGKPGRLELHTDSDDAVGRARSTRRVKLSDLLSKSKSPRKVIVKKDPRSLG